MKLYRVYIVKLQGLIQIKQMALEPHIALPSKVLRHTGYFQSFLFFYFSMQIQAGATLQVFKCIGAWSNYDKMEKNSTETAKARVRLGRGNSNKFDRQVREKNNGEKKDKNNQIRWWGLSTMRYLLLFPRLASKTQWIARMSSYILKSFYFSC